MSDLYRRLDIPTPEDWEWEDAPESMMVNEMDGSAFMLVKVEPVLSGYWCDTEGIYFTDPQEHTTEATWRKRDGGPLGHYGYECEGRKLTRRVVIVEATDAP